MTSRDVSRFALSCVASLSLASCGASVGTAPQPSNVVPSASGRYPNVLFAFTENRAKRGIVPDAPVIFDGAGAIYGTTVYGGNHGCYSGQGTCGTVFKLTPAGSGYSGETVLYAFCRKTKCRDGSNPRAGLIFDSQGSLYGTTSLGGSANGGAVFKLTPSKSGYSESVLYSFCQASNCSDGESPTAGVIFDKNGALYGTTEAGGLSGCPFSTRCGTVFKLTPSVSGYTESVLYSFCKKAGCSDGATPVAGLVFDAKGTLYGTTEFGGPGCPGGSDCGTVFKLRKSKSHYIESVLYGFCAVSGCTDGAEPAAGVIFDKKGALYGTTRRGGPGDGVAFRLTPSGSGYTYSMLHGFCVKQTCRDGAEPFGGLTFDHHNALYGTTTYGGGGYDAGGTLFKLTPSRSGYAERVLYRFFPSSEESWPVATPIFGPDGALYGTSTGHEIEYTGAVWRVELVH